MLILQTRIRFQSQKTAPRLGGGAFFKTFPTGDQPSGIVVGSVMHEDWLVIWLVNIVRLLGVQL
jgi:hypothetical protein